MDFVDQWIIPAEASGRPGAYIAAALAALLLVALSKGGFGGGVGVLSVPILLQVVGWEFAVSLWLPVLVVCDICTIHKYPREWSPRAIMKLAPGALIGILATTLVMGHVVLKEKSQATKVHEAWLSLSVAVISISFVVMHFIRAGKAGAPPWKPTWAVGLPVGVAAGVTTMVAHAAGPITTMYLLPQQLDRRVFVGTLGRYYFVFNAMKIPMYASIGLMTLDSLRYGAWLMLLSPAGIWLGWWLNKRVSEVWFVRIVYWCLVIAAVKLAYDWAGTIFGLRFF
jgi:uncharacterized protein